MTRAELLTAYLEAARHRRFRPGSHDCALFIAGWVRRVTGIDHAEGWRGRYRSLKRGQTLLRDIGFEDHVALVASLLEETPPARARNGDIALMNGHALGILSAERVFVLHPDGLGSVTRLQAERAFRV
ncbi:hypothetical protein SAMN06265173_1482 [Thalassovita litoralis]|uniref:DUF6950 domain-containing protein n=1 Tax=Thalassovita litoralis TaxID=1010611 RepID=A0A521FRS3_9RHOB|nr:hypothetical protein [Thalassovita litoralis]SMO98935.1 hypothetical protein SAMN06265173_1482 [Thalassovita litoralis]